MDANPIAYAQQGGLGNWLGVETSDIMNATQSHFFVDIHVK
jgi:hypothetical protein